MSAIYLVRFDDICPTMNWPIWDQVEATLVELGISPILAVIPDNRDPKLKVAAPDAHFWDRVRGWQARGWTIGLHGYQHLYSTHHPGLLGINRRTEFAGLAYEDQLFKLRAAVELFRSEKVTPKVWIAPAHTFDCVTLRVLFELGIGCVSDGFFLLPFQDEDGRRWVPQQLWRFRRLPFGLWTVCCHINSWTSEQLSRFEQDLRIYRPSIVDFDAALRAADTRSRTSLDNAFARVYSWALAVRRRVG